MILRPEKIHIIEMDIEFSSNKIFKYLTMNDVLNATDLDIVSKVNSNTCEIIHIAESYNKEMFEHSFIMILFADTL